MTATNLLADGVRVAVKFLATQRAAAGLPVTPAWTAFATREVEKALRVRMERLPRGRQILARATEETNS